MAEYIDRSKIIKESFEVFTQEYGMIEVVAVDVINEQPTVDVREVRRGKWIENEDGLYECSYCHKRIHYYDWDQPIFTEFCPKCGAVMEVE